VLDGANYIGIGPLFASKTKAFDTTPSLEYLKEIVQSLSIPAFAIGGIDPSNLAQVIECGGMRIAVCNAIWSSPSPCQVVKALRARIAGDHN
jgi:thiamine-phosphate pyrophosphorylase